MTDTKDAVVKLVVGGNATDDLAGFVEAWNRVERGEAVAPERVLAFETWDALAAVLTGERYRLLRHLHAQPMPSVNALAGALGRQYRRVHADVVALEAAGLIDRSQGQVRATADRLQAEVRL